MISFFIIFQEACYPSTDVFFSFFVVGSVVDGGGSVGVVSVGVGSIGVSSVGVIVGNIGNIGGGSVEDVRHRTSIFCHKNLIIPFSTHTTTHIHNDNDNILWILLQQQQ